MPWPLRPSRAHSPASWPGTGLAAGSTSAACDEATEPLNDIQAQPARGGGQLPGIVLREVRRDGENPGGDDVQQELTGAVCLAGHGDIRRRELPVRRAQIDADNRLAGSRSEVEPADLAWRVRAQLKHALSVHAHEDGRRIRGNGPI